MKFDKAKMKNLGSKVFDLLLISGAVYFGAKMFSYAEGKASSAVAKMKKPVAAPAAEVKEEATV